MFLEIRSWSSRRLRSRSTGRGHAATPSGARANAPRSGSPRLLTGSAQPGRRTSQTRRVPVIVLSAPAQQLQSEVLLVVFDVHTRHGVAASKPLRVITNAGDGGRMQAVVAILSFHECRPRSQDGRSGPIVSDWRIFAGDLRCGRFSRPLRRNRGKIPGGGMGLGFPRIGISDSFWGCRRLPISMVCRMPS